MPNTTNITLTTVQTVLSENALVALNDTVMNHANNANNLSISVPGFEPSSVPTTNRVMSAAYTMAHPRSPMGSWAALSDSIAAASPD